MNKAEQLKEKAKHETDHPNYYSVVYYRFSESELQERDTEIAREQRKEDYKLEDALKNYIYLLENEIGDNAVYLAVHGIKSKRVKDGIDARAEILKYSDTPLVTETK